MSGVLIFKLLYEVFDSYKCDSTQINKACSLELIETQEFHSVR
jgi:hypothetical protein